MTDAESVVAALRERDLTLATAESLTAGLLASTIAEVPGCSAVLRGGVVAYSSDVKASVLGVDARLLEHVVSEQVAARMALGATQVLSADIGVGTTGAAGPASLDGQVPGTVWIAVHDARSGRTRTARLALEGDRQAIRRGAVDACLAEIVVLVHGAES